MDYLLRTSMECRSWEIGETVTSPHHPIGAKGVGESPPSGPRPRSSSAVIDALAPMGITNIGHAVDAGSGVAGDPGRQFRTDLAIT